MPAKKPAPKPDDANLILIPPTDLKPNPKNTRKHSTTQIEQIIKSIGEFGFRGAILIGKGNMIIAGHARVQAAIQADLPTVPCIDCSDMTDEQIRGYIIADNQHALNATWDQDLLDEELTALFEHGMDPAALGFEAPEPEKGFFNEDEDLPIEDIDLSEQEDRFWISVRGPLNLQADALEGLKKVMEDYPGIDVELGTTTYEVR